MTYRRLSLLVLVVAVLIAGMPSPADADNVTARRTTLQLLNQTRRNHGLPVFRLNANVSHFAWKHSKKMAELNRCIHTTNLYSVSGRTGRPVGRERWSRRHTQTVRTLWMGSGGHRASILNPRFRRIGIGVVKARGLLWVTTIFYGG